MGAIEYLNCGDWVESCSALIEHADGRIELYRLAADAQAGEVLDEETAEPLAESST
ncbi:hypothetical protein D3C75_935540 [compost metagenome]